LNIRYSPFFQSIFIDTMHSKQIAYFISPHGYGHAARASAVMEAIYRINPWICFEVFTNIPEKFIRDSVSADFQYHSTLTDIGLVQKSPLHADIEDTVKQLDRFIPFEPGIINALSDKVKTRDCIMVVCDIAPMGIAVARKAGIPSLLIENFTWDWLYREYSASNRNLEAHINYMKELFSRADYHIQTQPVCSPVNSDLTANPVSRPPRTPSRDIRKSLNIEEQEKSVMISMGGVPDKHPSLKALKKNGGLPLYYPRAGA
jgi:hypothetical protein